MSHAFLNVRPQVKRFIYFPRTESQAYRTGHYCATVGGSDFISICAVYVMSGWSLVRQMSGACWKLGTMS